VSGRVGSLSSARPKPNIEPSASPSGEWWQIKRTLFALCIHWAALCSIVDRPAVESVRGSGLAVLLSFLTELGKQGLDVIAIVNRLVQVKA